MESLSVGLFGEIYSSGSMLGFVLLIYSSSVSALCIFKKRYRPSTLSEMEKTDYANIVRGLFLPTVILQIAYSIAYTSPVHGFFIWAIASILLLLTIKVFGFNVLAGVHALLSGIALAAGGYMVLNTFPF
jgi:hypothetical protein